MKKAMKIFISALVTVLCLSLCACGFVSYVKYDAEDAEDISALREEYLGKLYALSNEEYYRENERREYLRVMLDAENELRECSTAAKLEEVFERHSQIITDIPTDLDLTVSYLSEQLVCSLPTVLYREKEQAMIDNMLSEYLERMQGIANAVEGEKLIYEFKTLVAGIKTDSEYEAEELAVLKAEFSSFGEDIDFSLYPTGSHEELRQLPIDFKAELEKTSKTDECKALVERYTAKLSSIYTLEKRLEAGREAWRERWEDMLSSFDDADAVLECLKKIEKQTSGEGADRVGAEFILEHATELAERKSALGIYVNGIATLSDYRQAQREEIRDIADKYRKQIDAADGIEMLLDIKERVDAEVDAIPTNDELWEKEDLDFSIHMQTKYEGLALTPPECLYKAESVDELARIIDYYAFYQVNAESFERGTFRVELDFAHKYADYVIKDVYWYCELIRSAVGISGYFETDSSHLVITLTPYDIASKTSEKETTPIHRYDSLIEYVSGSTLTARDQDFDGFAYYEKYAGRYITVWNSQQLWYALEHEYIPIPVADSPAEKVLERAKEILREIVKEGMTIEEKIFVIYSWYGNNVVYDHESYDSVVVEDRKNFPDSLVAELRSFHAEGALLDNLGVCCSCAKSALIMMRLEGIEAYRVILHAYEDNAIDNLGRSDYGSHAIISLRASDGKFYYCDVQQARSGPDLIYKKYHQLLVTAEEQCPYNKTIDRIWNHLDYGKEFPTNLLWNKLEYNGNNLLISTEEELDALLDDYLSREGEKKHINVFVHSLTFSITDLLDANGSVTYHLTASYGGFEEYVIIIS